MRKFLLALFLSVIITFLVTCVYVLYPLVSVLLRSTSSNAETGGVAAVAGGVGLSFGWLLVTEIVVFMITFATLSRKHKS